MGLTKFCMVIVMTLFMSSSSMWVMSTAQSSSSNGCHSVIITLAPCLDYIEAQSSSPSSSCCTQLDGVIKTQPQCLCEVVTSSGSPAVVKINKTQAMTLPSACKVQAPPLSQCSGAAGSGSQPGSPLEKSPTISSSSTSEEGGSNAEAASPPGHSNAGNVMYSPMLTISWVFFLTFSQALNFKAIQLVQD